MIGMALPPVHAVSDMLLFASWFDTALFCQHPFREEGWKSKEALLANLAQCQCLAVFFILESNPEHVHESHQVQPSFRSRSALPSKTRSLHCCSHPSEHSKSMLLKVEVFT